MGRGDAGTRGCGDAGLGDSTTWDTGKRVSGTSGHEDVIRDCAIIIRRGAEKRASQEEILHNTPLSTKANKL